MEDYTTFLYCFSTILDFLKNLLEDLMISYLISEILYNPPDCSYLANDPCFSGNYFEMYRFAHLL